jgi:uncharacterized membrane protein YeaQ/YmgE (transglycosylase-associated protein family)
MDYLIVAVVMVPIGLLMGFVAGKIWKDDRPIGVRGDYVVAVVVTVLVGVLEWYLLPLIGIGQTVTIIAIAMEPALVALLVLWLIRVAKRQ